MRNSACLLLRLIASRVACLFPAIAPGFHDDVRTMSATKSSMSLTTTAYCLDDFIPPYAFTPSWLTRPFHADASGAESRVRIPDVLVLIEFVDRCIVTRQGGVRVIPFVCAPQSLEIVPHALHFFEGFSIFCQIGFQKHFDSMVKQISADVSRRKEHNPVHGLSVFVQKLCAEIE
jgi:hypothetical protein